MSFPHMFLAATNQWKAGADRDPATDTYASPDLWANFADFYRRAATASKLAQDASTTKRLDEFKRLIGEFADRLQRLPREIYEEQLTPPVDLPTIHPPKGIAPDDRLTARPTQGLPLHGLPRHLSCRDHPALHPDAAGARLLRRF